MRTPRTLRTRLALSAFAVGAGCVVVLTVASDLVINHQLRGEAAASAREHAQAALTTVTVGGHGSLVVSDTDDKNVDVGTWVFQGSVAIERAFGRRALQDAALGLAGTSHLLVERDTPQPVDLYSLGIRDNGVQVGTVVVAVPLAPYTSSIRKAVLGSVAVDAVLLLLVYPLARLLVGRALTPVEQMTRQASAWSAMGAAQRFGDEPRPGELAALAMTLDDLLDRLSSLLRREQLLSAEISHELRTPLAGIVAEVELFATRQRTMPDARRALRQIGGSARRLESLLDTLLASARATEPGRAGRCDVRTVLQSVESERSDARLEVDSPEGLAVGVEAPVVERILGPILDNALRFAATRVQISAHADALGVCLDVIDDGPGVPAGQDEHIFEPGVTGAGPNSQHSGLGLALARRLARGTGGDLLCLPAEHGGHFLVRLPRG